MIEQIKKALEKASTQHPWDTDGTFIAWKDGHPLKGTYRQIALTQALVPESFRNENHENDAHLIANAPEWLRYLIGEVERLQDVYDEWHPFGDKLALLKRRIERIKP